MGAGSEVKGGDGNKPKAILSGKRSEPSAVVTVGWEPHRCFGLTLLDPAPANRTKRREVARTSMGKPTVPQALVQIQAVQTMTMLGELV